MTTGRYKSGREPFEVIEIDQDFCEHEYGDSNCGAVLYDGLSKCYNTIGTCQSTPDYLGGVLTLRFCTDTPSMPNDGLAYFPFLVGSPKVKAAEINPGGAKRTATALGKRATISVTLSDHPWNDKIVDKYQAERLTGAAQFDGIGYDPVERSTFWRKWKARNLYYLNRPMRYISGYIENGQIVDAVTRYFVITGFDGPRTDGSVTIQGQDILYLAQRQKAEAPRASTGKLLADINASATSFTLNPVGVGDGEYPASGYGRIGSEIIEFTRAGDVISVAGGGRGAWGTIAAAHQAGDTFQLCWAIDTGKRPDEILYELLSEYSEIADGFLDTTQWAAEALDFLPTLYTGIVTEPTAVADLIAEMCEQMYFYAWFDERDNKVKIRAVRPAADETVYSITEENNIVAGSVSVKDEPDQVITRLVINYSIIDPTRGLDEVSNYRVTDVFGDLLEEGNDRNRGSSTKVINSRWISGGNAAAAESLGERLLARYKVPPRTITWQMDAKDRDAWVSDFANITTYQIANQNGLNVPTPCQILSATESTAGTTYTYMAQQFQFELPPADNERPLVLAVDTNNLNLRDWYDSVYGDTPTNDTIVSVTIRPAIVVGSSSTATPALTPGTWPSGATINIRVEAGAYIVGAGGDGGNASPTAATDGQDGGVAIDASRQLNIENYGIIGGGGGGGAACTVYVAAGAGSTVTVAGGGGAGHIPGQGGSAANVGGTAVQGEDGTKEEGGYVESPVYWYFPAGGDLGEDGQPVDPSISSPDSVDYSGLPGSAGAAIDGISNVTWINKGDVRGPEI